MCLPVLSDLSRTGIDKQLSVKSRGLTTMGFPYSELGGLALEARIDLVSGRA